MSPHSDPLDLTERPGRGAFALLVVLLGLLLALVAWRHAPPAPRPATAEGGHFSAERARDILQGLLGDFAPHPVGSAANAAVRARLLAELERLGYRPQVQTFSTCSLSGGCARPANVVAQLDGKEGGRSIVLMAHYDSVPAGPGVSDDASGVAAMLEIARILAFEGARRNSIVFLFTDGEEAGLLGAKAFFEHNPWAAGAAAVINLEARGTTGPSLMFETGRGNGALVPLYARAVARPVTSSLFVTLYETLPNDTDFTIFKRAGVPGFNFAFIGGAVRYHAPNDDLASLDLGSLQHHGDNALALARALGDAALTTEKRGNAVFFDVLAAKTIWWPRGATLPLAAAALLSLLLAVALLVRRGRLQWGEARRGLLAWVAAPVATGIVAYALLLVVRLAGGLAPPWANFLVNRPLVPAFWLIALAVSSFVAARLGARAGHWGLWAGAWLAWGLVGVTLALRLPGASYLFILPALSAAFCGLAAVIAHSPRSRFFATLIPGLVAGMVWFPILLLLLAGLGNQPGLLAVAIGVAIVASTLTPELSGLTGRRGIWPLAALAAGLFFLIAGLVGPPAPTPPPERLLLVQEAGSPARWMVPARSRPAPTPRMQKASVPFDPAPAATLPWLGEAAKHFSAPAAGVELSAPEVTILGDTESGGERHLTLRVRSLRGAAAVRIHFPERGPVHSLGIEGASAPLGEKGRFGPPLDDFAFLTPDEDGVEVEIVAAPGTAFPLVVADEVEGALPEGITNPLAPPLRAGWPADRMASIASRRVEIGAAPVVAPLQ